MPRKQDRGRRLLQRLVRSGWLAMANQLLERVRGSCIGRARLPPSLFVTAWLGRSLALPTDRYTSLECALTRDSPCLRRSGEEGPSATGEVPHDRAPLYTPRAEEDQPRIVRFHPPGV